MKRMSLQDKQMQFATEHKVYCKNKKCSGHGVVFKDPNLDFKICVNCGNRVYRDEKTKLKYEMLERGVKIDN